MNKVTMSADYDKYSKIQQQAILGVLPSILRAVDEIQKETPTRFNDINTPFTIADLGCASGTNTLVFLTPVIDKIRGLNKDLPIVVYLNDLPVNNFSKAMTNVTEGLKAYDNIWVYSTGGSFVGSLFPSNSIDLFVCVNSIQWMRSIPANSNQFGYVLDEKAEATEEGKLWAKAANEELLGYLQNRLKEIRPTGKIFIESKIHDPSIEDIDQLKSYFSFIKSAVLNVLKREGITHDETKINIPGVIRSYKHFLDILDKPELKGLKLLNPNEPVKKNQFPYFTEEPQKEAFIDMMSLSFKAATCETLKGLLEEQNVSVEKANFILDEAFGNELPSIFRENYEIFKTLGLNNTTILFGKAS
jgi:hypothetical protein